MLGKVIRFYYTIKPLKLKQFFYQIVHLSKISNRLVKSVQKQSSFRLRDYKNNFVPFIPRVQSVLSPDTFKIFNHTVTINHPEDWLNEDIEPLFRYNLHYFDDLIAESESSRNEWHVALLKKWVDDNSAGTVGWDAYPICRRTMNTIKWVYSGHTIPDFWGLSLLHQLMVLNKSIEWRLMANHLWENGVSLIAAGLFYEGADAKILFKKGFSILDKEISRQVGLDGGHFERSPMYHSILLEGLLDLKNIYRVVDRDFPAKWNHTIIRMIKWLQVMTHPCGDIPFFNDTTLGVAPEPDEIFRYAERLGFKLDPVEDQISHLSDSGFVVIKQDKLFFVMDIGTIGPAYQPGHAHSEELSFELSINGHKVICNSGISTYKAGPQRNIERSAAAHNCLVVDNRNPSDIWSSHRVAKRAKVVSHIEENNSAVTIVGSHDGYKNFQENIVHERVITFDKDKTEISINDSLTGNSTHEVTIYYHLAPEIECQIEDGVLDLSFQNRKLASIETDSNVVIEIVDSEYHPGFGETITAKTIHLNYSGKFPKDVSTRLSII